MSGTGGFQTQAYPQPSMAVAGDFCSQNPYFTVDAGPGGLVSGGPNGVAVGRFAWAYPPNDPDGAPTIVQNFGNGPVWGFVHREQQGLITVYLQDATQFIAPGYEMALMNGGDFWVVNDGTTQALPQGQGQAAMKAYANLTNGKVSFAPTGSPTNSATSTSSSIQAVTTTFTGSINGDVLTVATAPGTLLVPGAILTGTAGTIPAGTQIVSQLSGTQGGVGTYLVTNAEITYPTAGAPSPATITASWGVLTVGGTLTGTWGVGGLLSGTGVAANTYITSLGTGAGGAGTYNVNNGAGVGAGAVNLVGTVETKWYCMSSGLPGELVKISSHSLT
jgi:hypothetical protein